MSSGTTITDRYILEAATAGAQQALEQFQETTSKAFKASQRDAVIFNKALGLAQRGARALFEEFKKGLQSAAEFDRTTTQLSAALRGQGLEVDRNLERLQKQSAAFERVTGTSDEVIRSLQAQFINIKGTTRGLDDYTRAAFAMARTTDRDVNQSLDALLKLETGIVDRTLKLVPGINSLTKEQLKSGEAIRLVNDAWGENVDLLTREGITARITNLGNAWANLAEAIGKSVTQSPLVKQFLDELGSSLQSFADQVERRGVLSTVLSVAGAPFGLFQEDKTPEEALTGVVKDIRRQGGPGVTGAPTQPRTGASQGPAGRSLGGGRRRQGRVRRRSAGGGQAFDVAPPGAVITFGGLPIDASTGQVLPPAPPDPEAIRASLEREQTLRAERDELIRQEQERQLEQRREFQAQLSQIDEEGEQERLAIQRRSESQRTQAVTQGVGAAKQLLGNLANEGVDLFIALAKGEKVALDQIVKQFLEAEGRKLVAMGISTGLGSIFPPNPAGAAVSAIMLSAGAAMIGGSLAIPAQLGGGAVAAGGGLGGGVAGAGGGPSFRDIAAGNFGQQEQERGSITIVIPGALTPTEVVANLGRATEFARQQGFSV